MYYLLIILTLFSGCSLHTTVDKKPVLTKFYLPTTIKIDKKLNYWYKKEGTSFLGIIDSNNTIGGSFFIKNNILSGVINFETNSKEFNITHNKIMNCDTNSSKLKKNIKEDFYIIKVGSKFCFIR